MPVERRNNEESFVSLGLCFREPSLMDEAFADNHDAPLHLTAAIDIYDTLIRSGEDHPPPCLLIYFILGLIYGWSRQT